MEKLSEYRTPTAGLLFVYNARSCASCVQAEICSGQLVRCDFNFQIRPPSFLKKYFSSYYYFLTIQAAHIAHTVTLTQAREPSSPHR